jgi:serine/threonine protein kinase/Tol biopolymer transport system component
MSLKTGGRVGSYEIVGAIGAGGMGEVYRARDTRLKRDVALKLLPESFAADPDRLARFQREAEVLASLNHPNIAAIYGLEEGPAEASPYEAVGAGSRRPLQALVMELVEGETLADRIARGAIPIDEALPMAKQIAEALEAAHEQGIIHRDLKPANIKVKPDGTVKVLDFGLAKLNDPNAQNGPNVPNDPNGPNVLSMSPTITSPALMTGIGVLLGTAAYMSPEQAKGKPADKRSDVWAFGCVLYEMLTGRRAFEGEDVADTLANVLKTQPDWHALPAGTPPDVRRLLGRCLQKDPHERLPHIGGARLDINAALSSLREITATPDSAVVEQAPRRKARLPWLVAAALFVVLLIVVGRDWSIRKPVVENNVYRAMVALESGVIGNTASHLALSPDGRRLAFVAADANNRVMLWVRPLDGVDAQPLAGTEGAAAPFWSPDNRFLAFVSGGKLRKIDTAGGPIVTLCDAEAAFPGAWSADGVILFTPKNNASPLFRVSAAGGAPSAVTTIDADKLLIHVFPSFLPDGRHFLYLSQSPNGSQRNLELGSLDSKDRQNLMGVGSNAQYARGQILFINGTTLLARPFDAVRLGFTGDAVPLADDIREPVATLRGGTTFAVSDNGVLVYRPTQQVQLEWVDRTGKRLGVLGKPFEESGGGFLSLAPNGVQAAIEATSAGNADLVLLDTAGRTRFTADREIDAYAVWSADGRRIVFNSRRKGHLDLYEKAVSDPIGSETLLLADSSDKFPTSWSPDGRYVLYASRSATTASDLWILPLGGERKPYPFRRTPFSEGNGMFSPDGRWVAYTSDELGQSEVFIAPFPDAGTRYRISTAGGFTPQWRNDGKEIFYAADGKIMSAPLTLRGDSIGDGLVNPLFDLPASVSASYSWDVTADGQRFLVKEPADESTASLTLLVNWPGLLGAPGR